MEAIIFTGIQASGKTTFYLEKFFRTHLHLSLDKIKTRKKEQVLLDACFQANQSFVVDNTNSGRTIREKYLVPAKAKSRCKIIGYFFLTTLKAAIARNTIREGGVPRSVIEKTFENHYRQKYDEGFDELYTVEIVGKDFKVTAIPKE